MTTIHSKILARIRSRGRGKVYIPKDFLDLGNRMAVDQALSRLGRSAAIKRLGRGLYHYPKINDRLGLDVPPDNDQIVDALHRQSGHSVAASGATVANQLGLSTQVPAKRVYVTSGRTRHVKIGNQNILIKHAAAQALPTDNRMSGKVLQAIHYLGHDGLTDDGAARLRTHLNPSDRRQLLKDARYASSWVADAVRRVTNN